MVPMRAASISYASSRAAGLPQLLAQLALEVGRGGVGVGDGGDVAQRERLGDPLALDRHAEQVEDAADDGAGLAGARAGGDEDVVVRRADGGELARGGRVHHQLDVFGPPGTRQISMAWQNDGQPHDSAGCTGNSPDRAVRTWSATASSAVSSLLVVLGILAPLGASLCRT